MAAMEKVERSYAWSIQWHKKLQDGRRSIGRIAIWLDSAIPRVFDKEFGEGHFGFLGQDQKKEGKSP